MKREKEAARQGRVLVHLHLSPRTFSPFLTILSGLPCWLPSGRVWLMEMKNKTENNFQNEHWPKEGIKYESRHAIPIKLIQPHTTTTPYKVPEIRPLIV